MKSVSKLQDGDECPEGRPCAGRPRSESSRVALLQTAYRLMMAFPVHRISTQQIAKTAGVSTATVYRWWPTKEALLLDAYLQTKRRTPAAREGSALERLRQHVVAVGRFMEGRQGRVAARLLAAIQDNEELRKEYFERLYLPKVAECLALAQEAVEAGELARGTDLRLLLDSIFGTMLVRLMMRKEGVKRADMERAFDFAVGGARPKC